jgi:hypothetical protein
MISRGWNFLAVVGLYLAASTVSPVSSFESSQAVTQRREEALRTVLERPFPQPVCHNDVLVNRCEWGAINFALAALYLARDEKEIKLGNDKIASVFPRMQRLLEKKYTSSQSNSENSYDVSFLATGLLARLYFLFGGNSPSLSLRLTRENQEAIVSIFWLFARSECRLEDASHSLTWHIVGSENIDIMRKTACWAASEILASSNASVSYRYLDSSTPLSQKTAWSEFFKSYILERMKYGGLIEFFSFRYTNYTLQNFYNLADFASDPVLRRMSAGWLDIWWAEWAQEQIDGVHAGSKSRATPFAVGKENVGAGLAWVYFGDGPMPASLNSPTSAVMKTSTYVPPELVRHIGDRNKRGIYEFASRRTGLQKEPRIRGRNNLLEYRIDAAAGGVIRYGYVTPSFIMSTNLVPHLQNNSWAAISSQNRWSGVTLAGGPDYYVFAEPVPSRRGRSYNASWGIQHKGTQIVQKIPEPLSVAAGPMAIWVGAAIKTEVSGNWRFANSSAYVAFRPVFGDLIDRGDGRFELTEQSSPVIIQVAEHSNFQSYEEFKAAVLSASLIADKEAVRFRGLTGAAEITFYHISKRNPSIGMTPVDFSPPLSQDSPFIKAEWGRGIVSLRFGKQQLDYDFRN